MSSAMAPVQLEQVGIFHGLSAPELARLGAALTVRGYRAGRDLITIGQPGDRVYFVLSGTVKVYVDHEDGTEVILALLGPGEVVGEMSVVDNLGRSASVTALEPSTLAWMERAAFWQQLHASPPLMSNMVKLLSRRLRLANLRIQAYATLDVEGRVALQLLALAQELGEGAPADGTRIPIRLSQHDLAALVGASRVRVNQIIVDYKRRGYLSIDRRLRITLRDPAALRRQLDDALLDPGPIIR